MFPERAMLFSPGLRRDWFFLAGLVPAGFAAVLALWAAIGGLARTVQRAPAFLRGTWRWVGRTASFAWRHRAASAATLLVLASLALVLSRNRLLFWVAREGKTAAVRVMTDASPSLARHRDGSGSTALHEACERGRMDAARALLDAGADLHARDALDRTPLHRAVSNPSGAIVALLLGRGAQVNQRDRFGRTPLLLACQCDSVESAAVLMEGGADPNLADFDGQTPLRASVRNPALITLLLDRGADPQEGGKSAWSPLHAAVSFGEAASVAALLNGGADPNFRDAGGNTPLHEVACSAEPEASEIARLLLDHGADPSLLNAAGKTPLQQAQGQCPGMPVVELLHALGAPGLPLEAVPRVSGD
jgi:ankyrin repeat protein